MAPKNFGRRLLLNNFAQKLDFDVLWFRRIRAYKTQEEKKEKKKENHCSQKWVGRDETVGYLKRYNQVKHFLPYLRRF